MSPELNTIRDRSYCAENGMYCRYMDDRSGYCIATSCSQMILIEQLAEQENENQNGRLVLKEAKEDDTERSGGYLQPAEKETVRSERDDQELPDDA